MEETNVIPKPCVIRYTFLEFLHFANIPIQGSDFRQKIRSISRVAYITSDLQSKISEFHARISNDLKPKISALCMS